MDLICIRSEIISTQRKDLPTCSRISRRWDIPKLEKALPTLEKDIGTLSEDLKQYSDTYTADTATKKEKEAQIESLRKELRFTSKTEANEKLQALNAKKKELKNYLVLKKFPCYNINKHSRIYDDKV